MIHFVLVYSVVLDVLQNWPPLRYIVAAEQEPTSQSAIVKVLWRNLFCRVYSIYIFLALCHLNLLSTNLRSPLTVLFSPTFTLFYAILHFPSISFLVGLKFFTRVSRFDTLLLYERLHLCFLHKF